MGIMVRVPKPKQEQLVMPNRSHTGVAVVTATTASKWPRQPSARNIVLHDHVQEDPIVVLPPELEASHPSIQRYGCPGPPPGTNQDHRKMISDASLHLLTVPLVS